MCIRDSTRDVPTLLLDEITGAVLSERIELSAELLDELLTLHGLTAVSYTHLDVYKRQRLGFYTLTL